MTYRRPSNITRSGSGKPAKSSFALGGAWRGGGGSLGNPSAWAGWGTQGSWGYWDDNTPITDGTQVIQHDGLDVMLANRAIGAAGKIGPELDRYRESNPTAEALGRDLFWSLYKRNVRKQDVPLRDSHLVNGEIIDSVINTDEWLDLHATAMGDQFLADMAASQLAGPLLQRLSSETTERISRQTEMLAELEQLRERAKMLQELHEQNPSEKLRASLEATELSQAELEAKIAEIREGLSDEEREAMQQYLAGNLGQVASNVAAVAQGFQALGGSMGGGGGLAYAQGATAAFGRSGTNNKRKAEIAHKLIHNKKLRMIAELAGRMTDVAFQVQASKSPDPTDELTDVRYGRDIARMLPSEMIYLNDPDLELVFLQRFASAQLASYEIQGYTPQGRGPLIVMIDNSGSMSGEPEAWSKAVMMALRMIAEQQKRDFVVIHFDSYVQRVDEFPKGLASPEKMLTNIEFFSGGGTNFEPPMNEALKWMRQSRYRRADTIFVTDGLCAISEDECKAWNEMREKSGMHSYCILIGDDRWGRGVMEKITDRMMVVDPSKIMEENSTSSDVLQTVFGV